MRVLVNDDQTSPADLVVHWSSSRDGDLSGAVPPTEEGVAQLVSSDLTPGTHTITVKVSDSDGLIGSTELDLTIVDVPDAPDITIVRPIVGDVGYEGEAFELIARVVDDLDPASSLQLFIDSDVDGEICVPEVDALGEARCEALLSNGEHTLTFTAIDQDDNTSTKQALIRITPGGEIDDDGDGFSEMQGDCDDTNSSIFPSAAESCNSIDDDCDGQTDEGLTTWYEDDDGDGHGDPTHTLASCAQPSRYVANGDDCDDLRGGVHPGASEACNGIDDDCDGSVDEFVMQTYHRDADGDGYGSWETTSACYQPGGYVSNANDCYDGHAQAYPGSSHFDTSHRGDGSFDYNCDGWEGMRFTTTSRWECTVDNYIVYNEHSHSGGWLIGRPDCGGTDWYATGCETTDYVVWVEIDGPETIELRTQSCN